MYSHKEVEQEAGKILKESDIKKAVRHDKSRKKLFSFLEGPPTANAPPGLHHLEVRTYKDIINKFRYMQGFNVPRKAGWDCHGLPVEVQIEKKLKLNSKKEILKYGEDKFIRECKESVFSYINEWNKSTKRLGYWVDLEKPYITLDNDYIESVWWSLKTLYEKKLLYEAHKVVPFCPRCETPLSSHEVAQGYRRIKEDSIIVKFRLKEKKNEYLLVFTTTPWTLPSNLAIAVNPSFSYAFIKDEEGNTAIIEKNLAGKYFDSPKIIKEVKGSRLIGEKYEPLFPYFKKLDAFRVIGGEFVTEEEGTGLVHMAPAFGEVDYDACRKEKLPFVQPVDEAGKFTEEIPEYKGKFIKDADREITKRLKEENKIFKIIKYEHDYPFCWRCDTPLMYYAIKSWFVKVTAHKDRLIKLNEKINWVPKHIKEGRFGEWLSSVKDWALSRKKFWGTPLPVWRCECGNEQAIGSISELKKESLRKLSDKEIDLHKPWIDSIKIKCGKCGKEMARVPDVIDCWYDSGSAAFAQFHYPFENKEEFEKRVPYDFISEAIDQTRGWFYTMHALSTLLFGDIAYKNVICAGHIVDEKGEKMSKSKGNILDPEMVMNTIGVDATRIQFCTVDIGSSKKFGIDIAKKEAVPFLNVLWNTYQFYRQNNNSETLRNKISGALKTEKFSSEAKEKAEDKWIISRLNSLIKEVTENLENYQIEKGINPITDFVINDFSKTYIKMIRDREDENTKKVIGEILETVSKLLAPYAPNISEVIHHEFDKKTVHLSAWPKADEKKINKKLEIQMSAAMEVIEKGLAERDKVQTGLKWPLAKAVIYSKEHQSIKALEEIIKKQLNVKSVEIKDSPDKEIKVELDTKLTPELLAEGYAREVTRKVQAMRKNAGLVKENKIDLLIQGDEEFLKMVKSNIEIIREKVNAKKIELRSLGESSQKYRHSEDEKIREKIIKVGFNII